MTRREQQRRRNEMLHELVPEVPESPIVTSSVVGALHGWLSPEGDFYACGFLEHESFAWRIAAARGYRDFYSGSKALEEHEWVKLKCGNWIVVAKDLATQPQIDAIFDWLVDKGQTFEQAGIF